MYVKHSLSIMFGIALLLLFIGSNISNTQNINYKNNYIIQAITDYSDYIILTVSSLMLLRVFIKFATIDFEKCLNSTQYTCW
jgi:hypothetical protein